MYLNNAKLIYKDKINEDLAILRVAPDGWELPDFKPGQYGELALPGENGSEKIERRAYSIASTSSCKDYLEFYIVLVKGGTLTENLWNLEVGDSLWLGTKIKGKFTLDNVPHGKDIIAIATGTGLAPFLSMIETYKNDNIWNSFTVIHGARYKRDLGYESKLLELSENNKNIFYIPTLTREDWEGHKGRVDTIFKDGTYSNITSHNITPDNSQILLCGNPDMIDSTTEFLQSEYNLKIHSKKDPGQIHFERYW